MLLKGLLNKIGKDRRTREAIETRKLYKQGELEELERFFVFHFSFFTFRFSLFT